MYSSILFPQMYAYHGIFVILEDGKMICILSCYFAFKYFVIGKGIKKKQIEYIYNTEKKTC